MTIENLTPKARWLASAIVAASLTGCLSSGGGSSNGAPGPIPDSTVEEPANPPGDEPTSGGNTDPLIRTTTNGQVKGVESNGHYAFRGIPYAKPPVGELRFAAPQPAAAWTMQLNATAYGSDCVQSDGSGAEDCLFVNVFTPKTPGPHPVMVWIHGGAFIFGSGAGTYIPTRMVSHDTVVVTINYRLGLLGFLAHPGLADESSSKASGSYGLMDQQLALKWVKDNIAQFGGDAGNVTIFGESAGGLSVLNHLVSPASASLFDKAIVQSGSYAMTQPSMAAAQAAGEVFATNIGCDDPDLATEISCLRAKSVADILKFPPASVTPTLRPDVLPKSVGPSLAAGEFAEVPVISGTNLDEYASFLASGQPITAANYQAILTAVFNPTIAQLYDMSFFENSPSRAVSAAYSDYVFTCNASTQANSIQANSSASIYTYEFADRDAPPIFAVPQWLDAGAAHAFEIQYLFGDDTSFSERASEDQVQLANVLTRAWTNFARYGDPSATDGTFTWPAYEVANGAMVSFVPPKPQPLTGVQFRATHRCDVWDLAPR